MSHLWAARIAVVTISVLGSALSVGTPAHADTYTPGSSSQDFTTDAGGWTSAASYDGLCVPGVLCPTVTNGYTPSGGADGNGYLATHFDALLTTVAATVVGTWESPAFAYQGNAGKVPATAKLNLNIRPALGALIGVSVLPDASFRVDLVEQGTGRVVSAIPSTKLTASTEWTAVPTASIDPTLLTIGNSYTIRITTTDHSVAALGTAVEVGYDNVRLTTAGTAADVGTGGTGGGGGEHTVTTITTREQLRELATTMLPGSVRVIGNGRQVKVRVRCPQVVAPQACGLRLQGLSAGKHSRPATNRKHVQVRAGGHRVVKLRVRPKYVAAYQHGLRRVWLTEQVRVGELVVTVRKRVRLWH